MITNRATKQDYIQLQNKKVMHKVDILKTI